MVACAHTSTREARSVAAFSLDAARYTNLSVPTVLLAGQESLANFGIGIGLVSGGTAGARVVTMPGVDHEAITTGPQSLLRRSPAQPRGKRVMAGQDSRG